jgi:hypothetical protein
MPRLALLISGIVTVLVGLALVMPAVALLQNTGALPAFSVATLLVGIALGVGGGAMALLSQRRRA